MMYVGKFVAFALLLLFIIYVYDVSGIRDGCWFSRCKVGSSARIALSEQQVREDPGAFDRELGVPEEKLGGQKGWAALPFVDANQSLTYSGPFINTTLNGKGTVVIELTISTDNVVSGFIDFTQSAGEEPLCGAGHFAGTKQKNFIKFTFTSRDSDPGCVRGSGTPFTVTGTLSEDDRIFEGTYSIDDGQHGIFRVTKTTGNDTTNHRRKTVINVRMSGQHYMSRTNDAWTDQPRMAST